ncbi:Hypothetical predicted protein [Podarcis lilfordi]|uniref:Uncharacterized protein n=1 Tax=Podarcis lilfordi TaxID=74358 RepID=A0AA35PJK4_9SAUR|nr:Hypothetical predicted protein [Podarcis lilfordi]
MHHSGETVCGQIGSHPAYQMELVNGRPGHRINLRLHGQLRVQNDSQAVHLVLQGYSYPIQDQGVLHTCPPPPVPPKQYFCLVRIQPQSVRRHPSYNRLQAHKRLLDQASSPSSQESCSHSGHR